MSARALVFRVIMILTGFAFGFAIDDKFRRKESGKLLKSVALKKAKLFLAETVCNAYSTRPITTYSILMRK